MHQLHVFQGVHNLQLDDDAAADVQAVADA